MQKIKKSKIHALPEDNRHTLSDNRTHKETSFDDRLNVNQQSMLQERQPVRRLAPREFHPYRRTRK